MKKKIELFIICMLLPLAVGIVSSLFSGNTTMMYEGFVKPSFSPPAALFPIVWTILFLLMGISSYLIAISDSPERKQALKTYGIQLAVNFFWSIIFFNFGRYLLAFFWLLLLILLIIRMIGQFKKISPLAAYLQIPYLIWCCFAAILNFAVFYLNK